jgi:hypothetical protein
MRDIPATCVSLRMDDSPELNIPAASAFVFAKMPCDRQLILALFF